jgi:flagellar motor switch protein FliN
MTDDVAKTPQSALPSEVQPWFDAWTTSTQNVLSQIAGQAQVFELGFAPFPAADSDLRYIAVAAGAVQGEMALRLSSASGNRLARKFLGEAAPVEGSLESADAISADSRDALEELLRQITGLAATSMSAAAGGEIQLQLSRAEAPWAGTADAVATLHSRDEAGAEVAIEIRMSPALAAAIATRSASASESAAAFDAVNSPTKARGASSPPNAAGYQRLFEVGLGVKLRFGTRRMLLRDVLALSSGLVVELENSLNSPVDLLLDGRVIARGDVVVIDGKYGLKVTEVVEPPPPSTFKAV